LVEEKGERAARAARLSGGGQRLDVVAGIQPATGDRQILDGIAHLAAFGQSGRNELLEVQLGLQILDFVGDDEIAVVLSHDKIPVSISPYHPLG